MQDASDGTNRWTPRLGEGGLTEWATRGCGGPSRCGATGAGGYPPSFSVFRRGATSFNPSKLLNDDDNNPASLHRSSWLQSSLGVGAATGPDDKRRGWEGVGPLPHYTLAKLVFVVGVCTFTPGSRQGKTTEIQL